MKWNWRSELPHVAVLAAMAGLAVTHWNTLPERVAIHFDLRGRPDGWGGRFEELALLPLVTLGVYFLLLAAPRIDPGRANYRGFETPYAVIRLVVTAVLGVVYGVMLQSYRTGSIDPGGWLPVLLGGLFVVVGNLMGKLRPNWFVGVRTPWTLSSKQSWNRTHRLAGWLLVITGIVFWVSAGVVPENALLTGSIVGGAGVLVAVVYSYFVWRGDPDKTPPAGTLPEEEMKP